jgi:hypothetical protein
MGPPVFKGKRKKGIFMSKLKPKSYKRKCTSTGRSPHKSPATKRMLLSQRSSTPFKSPSVKVSHMIWPAIDTILENVHSSLNTTKKSRRKMLYFEDDDNGGDQDKEIRDIEDSFTELNINGIENDNDMESSIDEEYKYIIQILPSVLRNLAESNQDNTLRTFIKLVHEKKFSHENIAFTLWCDLVKWYELKDTRRMRYFTDTLNFFGVG